MKKSRAAIWKVKVQTVLAFLLLTVLFGLPAASETQSKIGSAKDVRLYFSSDVSMK